MSSAGRLVSRASADAATSSGGRPAADALVRRSPAARAPRYTPRRRPRPVRTNPVLALASAPGLRTGRSTSVRSCPGSGAPAATPAGSSPVSPARARSSPTGRSSCAVPPGSAPSGPAPSGPGWAVPRSAQRRGPAGLSRRRWRPGGLLEPRIHCRGGVRDCRARRGSAARPLVSESRNISLVILLRRMAEGPPGNFSEPALCRPAGFGGADRIKCREPVPLPALFAAAACRGRQAVDAPTGHPRSRRPAQRGDLPHIGCFPMHFVDLPVYSRNFTTYMRFLPLAPRTIAW